MSARVTTADRVQAENVWRGLQDAWRDPMGALAEAFADAREAGAREVMDRLGPIIADAEIARQEIADEVYQ